MPPLPSVTDIKTYLGLTGSGDDALITERLSTAIGMAEKDTGRTFASGSNSVTRYSSNGQASLTIHDRPMTDASRTVTWNGVTLTESSNAWFLPDRRDPNITTTLQLRTFDTSRAEWYKSDPQWFDKNLDRYPYAFGTPNDIVITGILGQPFPRAEVTGAITVLCAYLYWRAKSGATGTAYTLTGDAVSLTETPPEYQAFVRDWRIYTAVANV